jgi:hypothetical protein
MELIGPLLGLLAEIGKIINFENSHSVQERVEELRKAYDLEISKGPARDDALIYSIRVELRDICELYCATIKGSAAQG